MPRVYAQPHVGHGLAPGVVHPGGGPAGRGFTPRIGPHVAARPAFGPNPYGGRHENFIGNHANTINHVNVNQLGNRSSVGWHNPYLGYHQRWVHGTWNGHHPGGWGWRGGAGFPGYGYGGGYGLPGYGGLGYGGLGGGLGTGLGLGLGMGVGYGLSSWLFGPMLYNWGYSSYSNPYYGGYAAGAAPVGAAPAVVQQPAVYDYSQPINSTAAPPDETLANQSMSVFDQARDAFRQENYAQALDLVDQALRRLPNDPTLHEFRALVLFALKRYDESAAAVYAVLSVGPGWDWTTLIRLYNNPETYTNQLRALEDFVGRNPQSAASRFVLAYHYLTEGHPDAALPLLKHVVQLQPKDQLSAQLVQQLTQSQNPATAAQVAQNSTIPPAQVAQNSTIPPAQNANTPPSPGAVSPAVPGPPAGTNPPPPGQEGKLDGTWTAQPTPDTKIMVTFQDQGHFVWKVSHQGKDHQFQGDSSYTNGILTLAQDQSNAMVGDINWQDPAHFQFKVLGGGPSDPGLSFTKSS
jgi:hypothetical protein